MKRTTLALAAAMTVALSVTTAQALEHRFSGTFKVQLDASNLNGTRSGQAFYNPIDDGKTPPTLFDRKAPSAHFVDSQARIGYTAVVDPELSFVSLFEIDYAFWGNSSYATGPNEGGALGADTVNIETKNLYLDAAVDRKNNVRLGMQGVDDLFKGIFVSADMAGGLLTHTCDKVTGRVGLFRFDDRSTAAPASLGRHTRDFFLLDAAYSFSKTTKVSGAYYFLKDRSDLTKVDDTIHMVGVTGETAAGPVTLTGFLVGQFGEVTASEKDLAAFAANLGGSVGVGPGTMRAEFLYASGDDGSNASKAKAFRSVPYESFYESGMVLLGRDKNALTIDNAIVYDVNNRDHGVLFATLGYDLPVSPKVSSSLNLGSAWNAKKQGGEPGKHLGTEINAELVYKLKENFTLSARGGYVFLGDRYDGVTTNGTPDDPYDVKLIAKVSF